MSNESVFRNAWLILTVAFSIATSGGANSAQSIQLINTEPAIADLESIGGPEQGVLRARADRERNRIWVLTLDEVRVYDYSNKLLTRRISLPAWSVARQVCVPDITLDRAGVAFVSSNAQPLIWRIELTANGFELREYEITLLGRESWAIGFGALSFDTNGSLYALTAVPNSLWAIDIASANAKPILQFEPVLNTCTIPGPVIRG